MKALVTGASSGIGRDIAKYLSGKGYFVYLVGRSEGRLEAVKNEIGENCETIVCDLSSGKNVLMLYGRLKDENIDILVNNAGFGIFGSFEETDIKTELELINTNITALHILTKLFYRDFAKRDSGYILNVASSAGFLAGPLLSSYYASKNYVLQLTKAIYEENRRSKKGVTVSVFCPGPVDTDFNNRANVKFAVKGISSDYAAKYAVDKMFKGKLVIIPTLMMKTGIFLQRFIPQKTMLKIAYRFQKRKYGKSDSE